MQFAAAHKLTTYVMLGAAFVALIGGGAVDPLTAVLGTLGLIASWWMEPPRFDLARHQTAWTVASMIALTYALLLVVARGDLLGGGTMLIVFLAVAKACQRRTNRDWGQLVFLSVAMLIAASVLNTGVLFAACFAVFVITSTWAFTLLHLRRDVEENILTGHAQPAARQLATERILSSRRLVDRRFFLSTGLVSLAVFAATVLLFLSIPRVGVGFAGRQQQSVSMVGFSDGVQLGGHGTLKRDQTIVMRVKVDAPYQGRSAPYLRWRGAALDHYSMGQWTRSPVAPSTDATATSAGPGRLRRTLAAFSGVPRSDLVRQEIWLEPLDTNVLFGASMPVAVEYPVPPPRAGRRFSERNDEFRFDRREAFTYVAYSRIEEPSRASLIAQGRVQTASPRFEAYRQIPSEITTRTRDLARTIVGDAATDYEKAERLRDWLRGNLSYSLELKDPGGLEPIDYFLFERKAGHCEYFASAFVILGREVGLYTRQVNGFLGGEWNEYDNYIAVRAGDAHSWAEVYLGEAGWVTFDATATGAADLMGRGASGPLDKLRRMMDSLRFAWSQWVIEYSLGRQMGLIRSVVRGIAGALAAVKSAINAALGWLAARWYLIVLPLGLLGAAWAFWRWRKTPSDSTPMRPLGEIATLFARVERALASHGHARSPATTPREFLGQVGARDPSWHPFTEAVLIPYYAAQWGSQAAAAQPVRDATRQLEAESLRRIAEAAARPK
ncbi:MAG: DUF3488 domain-containing protein [Myxococcales bacterium]|nr:DUF3488 domain-containing protein [Myxococcales bacterium]